MKSFSKPLGHAKRIFVIIQPLLFRGELLFSGMIFLWKQKSVGQLHVCVGFLFNFVDFFLKHTPTSPYDLFPWISLITKFCDVWCHSCVLFFSFILLHVSTTEPRTPSSPHANMLFGDFFLITKLLRCRCLRSMQGGSGWTPPKSLKSSAVSSEEYPFCHLRLGGWGKFPPPKKGNRRWDGMWWMMVGGRRKSVLVKTPKIPGTGIFTFIYHLRSTKYRQIYYTWILWVFIYIHMYINCSILVVLFCSNRYWCGWMGFVAFVADRYWRS